MNLDDLQPLLNWVTNNPFLSYIAIFLLSLSESLVVVGLIVPGIAIMTVIGALIGAGYLDVWISIFSAIIGAIIGDGLSYWIGNRFQQHIRDWVIFRKFPDIILRCEKFFAKHGGKSVVIGRFVGPVRPMIPAIAGMMKMSPRYFYTVNIVSAFIWAPVYLFPGIIFGNTLSMLPPDVSKRLLMSFILLIIALWGAKKLLVYISLHFKRRLNRTATKIWIYAENNSLFFLQKIIKHPLTHKKHQIDSFLFLICLLLITTIYIILTKAHLFTTGLNAPLKHFSLIAYNPLVNNTLLTIDNNASLVGLLVIFTGIFIYFVTYNQFRNQALQKTILSKNITLNRTAYLGVLLILSYFAIAHFIAYLVKYPKPYRLDLIYNYLYYYSFPDISMGLLTIFVGYIGIIKYCNNPKEYSATNYNFYAVSIILFFFTLKLFLGHAWLSDLVGSVLIACCLLLIFCIIYWQQPLQNLQHKKFNIFISVFIGLFVVINSSWFYLTNDFTKYNLKKLALNIPSYPIEINQWHTQDNLFKDIQNPIINIQWVGNKEEIVNSLKNKKWFTQPKFNFKNFLNLFPKNPNISKMPLVPSYYNDYHSGIALSKLQDNNKILNIRLWQSEITINNKPLWIGTVQYLKPQKYFDLINILTHWPRAEFSDALDKFTRNLDKNTINTKMVTSKHPAIDGQLQILLINQKS